jgi:CelD/BcsL family acetyltransferase involved in cellulose biosynthesis
VQVRVVDSLSQFASLAEDWERLHAEAATASVFSSFDWQHLWWRSYHRGRPLRLLVAEDKGVHGILPLYIDTMRPLRWPVRILRLVGTGGDTSPDDLGPVLRRGRERQAAAALARALLGLGGWDVLLLTDMDPANEFYAEIKSRPLLAAESGRSERIAFTALPATWDGWLKSLHRDRRYRIRNVRKKLNAAHQARFFVWQDGGTLDSGIDRLIQLHRKRWEQAGQAHAFSSPEYVGFHRAVMHACQARDRLRLYCLELDGQIAAIYYFYRFRHGVYLMQSGFDPDFSDVKPGQALLGYIVEHAIGEGHQLLDFLRGDHRYKDELATGERETVFFTALRPRPGALVYGFRKRLLPTLKARVLDALDRLRTPPEVDRP